MLFRSSLEVGKVVAAVWLKNNWARANLAYKMYLLPAVCVLMLITSMGIFGFLSKAHLDQAVPSGDIASQVSIFDDKIKTEKDNIEAAKKALKQMDAQVDERLARSNDDKGAERAVQIRKSQAKERASLQNDIQQSQKKISQLQTERAPVASQQRKVEAEVGPIKYIAALIYGDNPDANVLERAVRWVIILIVLVFDPLALVLILAADQTFMWHRPKRKDGWEQVWQPTSEAWPPYEPDFLDQQKPKYEPDDGPLTDKQLEDIKAQSGVPQDPNGMSAEDFINNLNQQAQAEADPLEVKNATLERELEAVKATAENLKKKFKNFLSNPLKK